MSTRQAVITASLCLLWLLRAVPASAGEPGPVAILDHLAASPEWIPLDEQLNHALSEAKARCRRPSDPECLLVKHIDAHLGRLSADLRLGRATALRAFTARHVARVLENQDLYSYDETHFPLNGVLHTLAPVFRRCAAAFHEAGERAGLSPASMLTWCAPTYCAVATPGAGCSGKAVAWPPNDAEAEQSWRRLMLEALRHEVPVDASDALGRQLASRGGRLFKPERPRLLPACSEPEPDPMEAPALAGAEACLQSGKRDVALRVVQDLTRKPGASPTAFAALAALVADGPEREAAVEESVVRAGRRAAEDEWQADVGPWSRFADPYELLRAGALALTSPSPWSWRPMDERLEKTVAALNDWCHSNPRGCTSRRMVTFIVTGSKVASATQRLAVTHAKRRLLDEALQDDQSLRYRQSISMPCSEQSGGDVHRWDWEEELASSLCPFQFAPKPAQNAERARLKISQGPWKVTVSLVLTVKDTWATSVGERWEAARAASTKKK